MSSGNPEFKPPRPAPILPQPPLPPVSLNWAQQMRFSKREYEQAAGWFQALWNVHLLAGRSGPPGRPDAGDRATFLKPSANEAETALADLAAARLDPCLGKAEEALGESERLVDELAGWPSREFPCEGRMCTVAEARQITDDLNHTIEVDTNNRHFHHQRVTSWWRAVSTSLLWADLAALVVILADLFNVDYTHPLITPVQSLTVMVLPVVLVIAQWFTADRAGHRLNEYREKAKHAADALGPVRKAARLWCVAAGTAAVAYTALLMWRLVAMGQDADLHVLVLVILVALGMVIGLGAPLTKVYVVADDGSSVSRRRDVFAAALDEQHRLWQATLQQAKDALTEVSSCHEDYTARLRPQVLYEAGAALVAADNALGLLNMMLGANDASRRSDPPPSEPPRPEPSATDPSHVTYLPRLRWGFPDAPEIDNGSLLSRDRTLAGQLTRASRLRGLIVGHRTMRTERPVVTIAAESADAAEPPAALELPAPQIAEDDSH
jgi:hypothetical protein